MGILNVTPDSFSDGGLYVRSAAAVDRALQMVADGAHIIDVGGESTRPGAEPVSLQEEIARVVPVVEAIRSQSEIPISVDTSKPELMRAAADSGASMINDVRALTIPGAIEAAASAGLPVCLMHMQGQPGNMQSDPQYGDVVEDVRTYLLNRANICESEGISRENIILDPGFGFGKTLGHNLTLLRHLELLVAAGYPVLAGLSRKSMIGQIVDDPGGDRLAGSVTLALYAARKGAHIVRVHDVRQTVDALRIESELSSIA